MVGHRGQHVLVAALCGACLLVACDGSTLLDASGTAPPEALFDRTRTAQPEVLSVSMSNNRDGDIDVVVRFSEPMQQSTVESSMAVVTGTSTITRLSDSGAQTLAGTFDWRPDAREVFFRVAGSSYPLILVIADTAAAQSGLFLDGKAAPEGRADIGSYHRFEEDGFHGAATYVSLPFYPGGSDDLDTHPSFLLSNARPGIVCHNLQFDTPVSSTGSLGTLQNNDAIRCRLDDRRFVPTRTGVVERKPPRAWSPDALPTAVFQQGGTQGTQIPGVIGLGHEGNLPIADSVVIEAFPSDQGLFIGSVSFTGEEDFAHTYIAPFFEDEPVWPVTGLTLPKTIWLDQVLWEGTAEGASTDDPNLIEDVDGQAWLQNEWVGQTLRNLSGGMAEILSNRANQLRLASPVGASTFDYQILSRGEGRYAPGQLVRLTSDYFTVTPESPLGSGSWKLILSGGRDLQGLDATDGVRDGDEIEGKPDDRSKYRLDVP